MITSIIFDFDGVIHDTFDMAYNINRQLLDISVEEYKDMFNGNIYRDNRITPEKAKEFFEIQNKEFKKLVIDETIKNELLKMKAKYDLFIVSSNMEEAMNDYIARNELSGVFREVLGMESHKSKIEKFKILINKYGLTRDNSFFITDTLGDILEANKVGLCTIAVDFGCHDRERLQQGNPLKIVSNFTNLAGEIAQL